VLPNLSFVIPAANENRWSDLFAALITADPAPLAVLLGVTFDAVRREITVPGQAGRKSDRLDLLLLNGNSEIAGNEVKLLSDVGPRQLERYLGAHCLGVGLSRCSVKNANVSGSIPTKVAQVWAPPGRIFRSALVGG